MDEIIRRIIIWKEHAKWAVRHECSGHVMIRILQEGVNLGHDLEQEWLKTRRPDAAQPSASDARPRTA